MGRPASTWQRVSRRRPCPVCGKPDWCMFTGEPSSPTAVICARNESPKRCGEGWLVARSPPQRPNVVPVDTADRIERRARIGAPALDFAKLAAGFSAMVQPEALDKLAAALGVSPRSLRRLGIGWSMRHRAWSFPMSNAAGDVLGHPVAACPAARRSPSRAARRGYSFPRAIS